MFTAIEAREFIRYASIQGERVAKTVIKTATSTSLGQRLMLGGLTAFVGLSADNKATWEEKILSDQSQSGYTLSLESLHLQEAQKIDLSRIVEPPPIQVPTGDFEVINRGGVELVRIYGENDPANRLFVQILLQKNATKELAKKVVNQFFMVDPMQKYLDKFTFWVRTSPTPDFNCDRASNCANTQAVIDEIGRTHNATDIFSPETIVLINSGSVTGLSSLDGYNPPSIYTYAQISTIMDNVGTDHGTNVELAHAILNLSDLWKYGTNRDMGKGFANCSRYPQLWGGNPTQWRGCAWDIEAYRSDDDTILRDIEKSYFGAWESTWIDRLMGMENPNFRYRHPKNEIKVTGGSLSLEAELITHIGTTQQKRWIIPANNDGPDITLLRNPESVFEVPAPQIGVGNYILLPDMTYTWKEWSSGYPTALSWNAPQWDNFEGWPGVFFPNTPAEIKVKTPKRFADGISAVSPKMGEVVNTSNPTLVWANKDTDVFYYEVQLSKDITFNTDPNTATAAVYWNLIHGGESKPLNSWTVPDQFPLQLGQTYYWRARPRIQGDGTPVEWSQIGSFKTPSALKSVTKEEFERQLAEIKKAEDELRRPTKEHWNWVEREVLTKTEIPLFDDNGEITTWISHSDNIPFEAYRREEDLEPAA